MAIETERFKWLLLSEAAPETLAIAYWWAKQLDPYETLHEIEAIVRDHVLALVDDGLVEVYWAKWSAEVPGKRGTFDRREIEEILRGEGPSDDAEGAVWFRRTEEGERRLQTLTPDALKEIYPAGWKP